jgi:hypothetical protein
MPEAQDEFQRRFRRCITLKDSEGLVGPEDLSAGNLPPKAASVTESLGFGQASFAPSEFLSQEFVLHDVHVSADDSL